jgi:hypothetical protein
LKDVYANKDKSYLKRVSFAWHGSEAWWFLILIAEMYRNEAKKLPQVGHDDK